MDTTIHIWIFALAALCLVECAAHSRRGSNPIRVNELAITSTVSLRYANVLVRSSVENLASEDREASFQVRIPREAFITGFHIVMEEKTIEAYIKEKAKATEEYNEAKESNVTAGIVTQQTDVSDDIDRDIFNVKVNVAAKTTLEFRLEYEELLIKNAGKYGQKIFVDSKHAIPNLEVICEFKEKQMFKELTYQTPLDEDKLILNEEQVDIDGYYIRKIIWRPSESEQEMVVNGLEKPFEIEYVLEPTENGGAVFINGEGDFVHMFSTTCDETKIMMKQIVFVIDISGSMKGKPVQQVRQTMKTILTQLRSQDYFNIIIFNKISSMWEANFRQATSENVERATLYIDSQVVADGGTNINEALHKALSLFGTGPVPYENDRSGQIVFFLTDGEPTVGVRNSAEIRKNVRDSNYYGGKECCKSTIYTIAFGENADIEFLSGLANEHEGTVTIIRESKEEDGEMLNLYQGVANPYFKDIEFTFRIDNTTIPKNNVTRTRFRQYDCGNELIVGGWTYPDSVIYPVINAKGTDEDIVFNKVPSIRTDNVDAEKIARLVVYEMVKHLLKEASRTAETNPDRSQQATERALQLSLQHGFVTPLTSLVLTDLAPIKPVPRQNRNKGSAVNRGPQSSGPRSLFSQPAQADGLDTSFWLDYTDTESVYGQEEQINSSGHIAVSVPIVLCLLVLISL